jgi:hypothetical protein
MNELTNRLKNAIDRFLVEMPPYWTKDAVERLLGDLQNNDTSDALKSLVTQGVIHLTKNEDCYLVVTESYLRKHLPQEFVQLGVDRVHQLLARYPICKNQ